MLLLPARSAYRPFPIMMGSILLPNTPLGFYPFEVIQRMSAGLSPCLHTRLPTALACFGVTVREDPVTGVSQLYPALV